VQIRAEDERLRLAVDPIDDPVTHRAVRAERSCLAALAGGCLAPIGVWGHHVQGGRLELGGCVLEDTGDRVTRIAATVSAAVVGEDSRAVSDWPESLGRELAGLLLARGAAAMLARVRARATHV
jgi:hydroxymethylbilane synthase